MKQNFMVVSDRLQESIKAYGDTTEYVNKKADLADALGFVASRVRFADDEKWCLIGELLAEYQDVIDLWHQESYNGQE